MLPLQRHEVILRHLQSAGAVRTTSLSNLMKVTDETIRRDLEFLASEGRLIRIHGGARLPATHKAITSVSRHQKLNPENLQMIGQKALSKVVPGHVIFLDGSTNSVVLAELLPDMDITVITNSLEVISVLESHQNTQVIGTGGTYQKSSRMFFENSAVEALKRHHIHLMFLGCHGIDSERGASESNPAEADFKERILCFADEIVLLVEQAKLGSKGDHFFASPTQITKVVTDANPVNPGVESLKKAGIFVETTPLTQEPPTFSEAV